MESKDNYERFFWSVEDKHFWFKGRQDLIKRFIPNENIKILDVGCASGGNLKSLDPRHDLYGIDLSREAIKTAKERGLKKVFVADAENFPFKNNEFDLIICSDLLEHVKDDQIVLNEIYRVLKKDGKAIIGVPAFNFLWTRFDEINRHYRRYTKKRFKSMIKNTNFKIKRFSYWNFSVFLPVFLIRYLRRNGIFKTERYDIEIPNKFINTMLTKIIKFENLLITKGFKFPFGVSLITILEK